MQVTSALGNPLFYTKRLLGQYQTNKTNYYKDNARSVNSTGDQFSRQNEGNAQSNVYSRIKGTLFIPYQTGQINEMPVYFEEGKGQRVNHLI